MIAAKRPLLKLYSNSSFTFRQPIKPENVKQRVFNSSWSIGMTYTENNPHKFTTKILNKCCISSNQNVTKGETKLVEFLQQHIDEKQEVLETIPSQIDDFKVELNASKVTLVKSLPSETITISFDIKNSLLKRETPYRDKKNFVSRPRFTIGITKGDKTLAFRCFSERCVSCDIQRVKKASDTHFEFRIFDLDYFVLYEGKSKKNNFKMVTHILEDHFSQYLMNFLYRRGINDQLVYKMWKISTDYAKTNYLTLLREMKEFVSN